ncbi:MAG: MFS transporter [Flavobacteriales bacterium]|nr:MFS transporter [Flavobacteriales bacterium]
MNYDKNFWLLCFSMFFFMASFNLILPELNGFITNLGGAEHKGLIISLFSVSAGISRPFSGKLSDTIGRKSVIYFGILISFVIALMYPLSYSVIFFLSLRFLHGFSAGFAPTGSTALVTDLIPADSRGKAMGIWGTFISLGIGVGQALGSLIFEHLGYNSLFMFSAIFTVISLLLVIKVEETLALKQKFDGSQLKIQAKDIFEPSVIPAAMVMLLTAFSSGIIFVITPDISAYLGINNKGFFFGIYVISTIVIRLFTSSLSDKIGRRQTLLIGCTILMISMILIATSNSVNTYILSAVVFGLATGVSSPTLFAWTADLSDEARRGVGAGTMFIALEIGIILGSASTILFYDNSKNTILISFLAGALLALVSALYLVWHIRTKKSIY